MATVGDIGEAAASVLSLATGLRATAYTPESINPPAAFVNVTEVTQASYGLASKDISLDLVVVVARSRPGQNLLDEYLSESGPRSVWAALADNKSLGLTDGTECIVNRYRSLGIEEIAAYGYVGGAFECIVTT